MPDLEGEELIDVKNNLLQASNRLLEAFDQVEGGDVPAEAALAIVDAHERLMAVHASLRQVSNRRLMARY
jgi:hypothetical protein